MINPENVTVFRFAPVPQEEADEVFDDTKCAGCGFTFGLALDQVLRSPEYRDLCVPCFDSVKASFDTDHEMPEAE